MAKNIVTWTLKQQDDSGTTISTRTTTITDAAPTVGDFRGKGTLTSTSLTAITLPVTQVRQVSMVNTHATAKITVTWTPNGVSSATIAVLGPGDGISLWHQTTGTSYGISALSLTSDTANATFEMFLGG